MSKPCKLCEEGIPTMLDWAMIVHKDDYWTRCTNPSEEDRKLADNARAILHQGKKLEK